MSTCDPPVYRAIVTSSNATTGQIFVRIPSLLGIDSTIELSKIGRSAHNGVWTVPAVNAQIVVTADDYNFTNAFWVQTDPVNNITAFDLDGGTPSSIYGGITSIDCGGV